MLTALPPPMLYRTSSLSTVPVLDALIGSSAWASCAASSRQRDRGDVHSHDSSPCPYWKSVLPRKICLALAAGSRDARAPRRNRRRRLASSALSWEHRAVEAQGRGQLLPFPGRGIALFQLARRPVAVAWVLRAWGDVELADSRGDVAGALGDDGRRLVVVGLVQESAARIEVPHVAGEDSPTSRSPGTNASGYTCSGIPCRQPMASSVLSTAPAGRWRQGKRTQRRWRTG